MVHIPALTTLATSQRAHVPALTTPATSQRVSLLVVTALALGSHRCHLHPAAAAHTT
ncbi:hypothetical protein [Streptomyces sp. NPDC087300]|uniref:hypothetical protein n=1 Tax=Streptomyces sp. NPDC087300 TaxID=3365780 RepID=UPI003829BF52